MAEDVDGGVEFAFLEVRLRRGWRRLRLHRAGDSLVQRRLLQPDPNVRRRATAGLAGLVALRAIARRYPIELAEEQPRMQRVWTKRADKGVNAWPPAYREDAKVCRGEQEPRRALGDGW
jgi:hypothetical protein